MREWYLWLPWRSLALRPRRRRIAACAAATRILREGWTADDAIAEMKNGGYGYHSVWGNLPRFIRKSAEQRAKAKADGSR